MIEIANDSLVFRFPEVDRRAKFRVTFQRTLRIPDDGRDYPLPPGLGAFPLRHVDDFAERVPRPWLARGGVMLPMYQSEAMWLSFDADHIADRGVAWPFAVKIAAGKIDAVTGKGWSEGLGRAPQDYLVAPVQPWLDGFCVEKGIIRQFVAMPLGGGYTAEEQITGKGEFGGIQILVRPMRKEAFERRFPKLDRRYDSMAVGSVEECCACAPAMDMGLGAGGRMRQEIYDDPYDLADWDAAQGSRCFVHLANSLVWRAVTGDEPPTVPPTAKEYTRHGLPWFEYYADASAVEGSKILAELESVLAIGRKKGQVPLPENEPVDPANVVLLRKGLKKGQVREGRF
ncbi:MAG: hypothetical protein MUE73_03460 [Planctomycetes bacterium]|jgi:hypothetical protein|nr:hypothetical protein [Planctomycetota bacterium]